MHFELVHYTYLFYCNDGSMITYMDSALIDPSSNICNEPKLTVIENIVIKPYYGSRVFSNARQFNYHP